MEPYKKVVLVSEQDEVIGAEYLNDAIATGRLRRASRVFIFDERGRLLVQRRSASVHSPLRLDQSVGGHVDEGEGYLEAAKREMKEELGLELEIEEVAISFRTKKFFNGIYRAFTSSDLTVNFNSNEVAEVLWLPIAELEQRMQRSPDEFTFSFLEIWPMLRDKIVPS